MYVNVPKLEQGTKDALAAKLYDAAAPLLKGPPGVPFGSEFRPRVGTGQPAPPQMGVATLAAGPPTEEKVNALAESMQAAVQEVLGEDKKLTLVFHDNGLDRIAIGGVTIATKMQKK